MCCNGEKRDFKGLLSGRGSLLPSDYCLQFGPLPDTSGRQNNEGMAKSRKVMRPIGRKKSWRNGWTNWHSYVIPDAGELGSFSLFAILLARSDCNSFCHFTQLPGSAASHPCLNKPRMGTQPDMAMSHKDGWFPNLCWLLYLAHYTQTYGMYPTGFWGCSLLHTKFRISPTEFSGTPE